jgi:polyisoprenoid-binding protein YceI
VREQLAFLPAQSDAVGRTANITGQATLSQSKGTVTVRAASFSVAVNTLKSDRSMRDEKIHAIGLESDRYPTATFVLSEPVTASLGATGHVVHTSATGIFTIHGTSRRKTVPLELNLSAGTFAAAGSLTFPWSAFDMTAPSVGGFVMVTDKATLEFDLRLQRA